MRQPRVFTPEEEILIKQLINEGKGYNVIANNLHTNPNKIREYLNKNNIEISKRGRPKSNKPKKVNKPLIKENHMTKEINKSIFNSLKGDHTSMPLEYNVTTANHLHNVIGLETIPNVDFNGITFDIGVPEAKTLVVTCPEEEQFNEWKQCIDGFLLSDFFREYRTYTAVTFLYKGEDYVVGEIRSHYRTLHRFDTAALKKLEVSQSVDEKSS